LLQIQQQQLQQDSSTRQIQDSWHLGESARLAVSIWVLLLRCLGCLEAASASHGCWQT
jgi:hypothetical protein